MLPSALSPQIQATPQRSQLTDPGCSPAPSAHRSRLLSNALSPQIQAALHVERSRPTKTERGVGRARGWAETEPPSEPARVSVVQLRAERASEGGMETLTSGGRSMGAELTPRAGAFEVADEGSGRGGGHAAHNLNQSTNATAYRCVGAAWPSIRHRDRSRLLL